MCHLHRQCHDNTLHFPTQTKVSWRVKTEKKSEREREQRGERRRGRREEREREGEKKRGEEMVEREKRRSRGEREEVKPSKKRNNEGEKREQGGKQNITRKRNLFSFFDLLFFSCERFLDVMKGLVRYGAPEDVRIVFWFDN